MNLAPFNRLDQYTDRLRIDFSVPDEHFGRTTLGVDLDAVHRTLDLANLACIKIVDDKKSDEPIVGGITGLGLASAAATGYSTPKVELSRLRIDGKEDPTATVRSNVLANANVPINLKALRQQGLAQKNALRDPNEWKKVIEEKLKWAFLVGGEKSLAWTNLWELIMIGPSTAYFPSILTLNPMIGLAINSAANTLNDIVGHYTIDPRIQIRWVSILGVPLDQMARLPLNIANSTYCHEMDR